MNKTESEVLVLAAQAELLKEYRDRGLNNDRERWMIALGEDLIGSLKRFLRDKGVADSIRVEAAFDLINDEGKGSLRYQSFVDGLKYGLGVVGAMPRTEIDIQKYRGELLVLQELGLRLPQSMQRENLSSVIAESFSEQRVRMEPDPRLRFLMFGMVIALR